MRIRHSELESVISNTSKWVNSKLNPQSSFIKTGYDGWTKKAILKYHKPVSADEARRYLHAKLSAFRDIARIQIAEDTLDSYIAWCESNILIVADYGTKIKVDIGNNIIISGQVSRVDILNSGYRAILLDKYKPTWDNELRMPLIQKGIAECFQRDENDVFVGVQHLDGSHLSVRKYNHAEISKAMKDATELADLIKGEFNKQGSDIE